jgi:hypothetical protein
MYTIPFDSEVLKHIITGDIKSPAIDYANSKIKGKNFITYLSNLKYENLNIDFTDIDYTEKSELICEFIKHNSTCHIEQLEASVLKSLFLYKGYDLSLVDKSEDDKPFLQKSILSNDEIALFVEQNVDLIKQLADLLDGIILLAIKNLNSYHEAHGDFITNNIVTEKQEVGKTFVNILLNEAFNFHYYGSLPKFDDLKYFDFYFDRPIYSGKTLTYYLSSKTCLFFPILKIILDAKFTPQQLNSMIKEADATLI